MDVSVKTVLVQFRKENDEEIGNPLDLPVDITVDKLQLICDNLIHNEIKVPYLFFLKDSEIKTSLKDTLNSFDKDSIHFEKCLDIVCAAQAIFHVQSVTRCSSSIGGHSDAIVSVAFSPDGSSLASGSGDTTVRFWDITTETPFHTCNMHKSWVLAISWSPDSKKLASADKNGVIFLWNAKSGECIGTLKGHKQWVNCLSWEPFHW